jgi:hypothetical protein
MDDQRREGFHDPLYCPRSRNDCKSLAQIISEGHRSFVCCGENDGSAANVPTDYYRFCHKTGDGVDVMMNHDQRDLAHMAAVYSWALATVIAVEAGHEATRKLHSANDSEMGVAG